jgi:sec-independent protein translocase protein TatA
MFGLGTQELVIILVIVLVIFGAGKLPQIGGALGKGIRDFKKGMDHDDDDDDDKEPKVIEQVDTEKKDS